MADAQEFLRVTVSLYFIDVVFDEIFNGVIDINDHKSLFHCITFCHVSIGLGLAANVKCIKNLYDPYSYVASAVL